MTGVSLTELGPSAFAGCGELRSIRAAGEIEKDGRLQLPEGLETLVSGVFSDCPGLQEVVLPEGDPEPWQQLFLG